MVYACSCIPHGRTEDVQLCQTERRRLVPVQLYHWEVGLNPNVIPEQKIIKTLIYGVVSSGNLAERCIRFVRG